MVDYHDVVGIDVVRGDKKVIELDQLEMLLLGEAKVELGDVVSELPVAADQTGSDLVHRNASVKVVKELFEELVGLAQKCFAIWKQIAIHIDAKNNHKDSY